MLKSHPKSFWLAGLATLTAAALCFWPLLGRTASETQPREITPGSVKQAMKSEKSEEIILPMASLDLAVATQRGVIKADCEGNGRDKMRVTVRNQSTQPVHVRIPQGQLFQGGANAVVSVRVAEAEIKPAASCDIEVLTAATNSRNKLTTSVYSLTAGTLTRIEPVLVFAENHPEVSAPALQTAILALMENLPVNAFAKFSQPGGDLPAKFDTTAFKVATVDIVSALSVLREIGCRDGELALTIDPQLKIEAMIDPLAHAMAMRYYNISGEDEWTYWKQELTAGNESTRHYALYGIARFYPDIALQMLPKWARETRTNPVYRLSAMQALAETQRPEALASLRQLEHEFGIASDLGKTAHVAAAYLDARISKAATPKIAVAFRASREIPEL